MKKVLLFLLISIIGLAETVTVTIIDCIEHKPSISYLQTKENGVILADIEDMNQLVKLEETEEGIIATVELEEAEEGQREILKVLR